MPSRRVERVGRALKQVISEEIVRLNDPRAGFVTVTDVEVAGDLKTAVVRFSVLGTEADERTTLRSLRHAHGFFQEAVSRELRLKFCPKLTFEIDPSIKRSARIADLLREASEAENPPSAETEPGDETNGETDTGQDPA